MADGDETPAPKASERATTKRSQTVSTVLVAGAGLAALGLGNLDRTSYADVLVYADAAACASEGIRPADECRNEYAIARASYPRAAPHYDTAAACEGHHGGGHCLTDPAGAAAQRHVPRMVGYLIGRSAAQEVTPEPVYEHRTGGAGHGSYCTGSGGRVSTGSGGSGSSAKVASSAVKSSAANATGAHATGSHATSFGGFGGTGHGFSAHGGS